MFGKKPRLRGFFFVPRGRGEIRKKEEEEEEEEEKNSRMNFLLEDENRNFDANIAKRFRKPRKKEILNTFEFPFQWP